MSDPIAIVNTPGGPATAANPPVEATLVIPDPDNPGGWIPDPGGGGGSGTVQSVAGVAPDEEGDVPLTHSDLGPIQVGDLGFDPETEEEMEAEVATLNAAIATKAPQSTTYTKTQVDALAAALKIKPYSTLASYGIGDVAVSPSGDLVQAFVAVTPATPIAYVGGVDSPAGAGTIAIPAGSVAGDLAVLVFAGYMSDSSSGAGFATLSTGGTTSPYAALRSQCKFLTASDIATGTIAVTIGGVQVVAQLRVYRNAATPLAPGYSTYGQPVTGGATITPPGQSVASTSYLIRAVGFRSDSSNIAGPGSVGSAFTHSLQGAHRGGIAQLTTADKLGSSALGDGLITAPAAGQVSYSAVGIEVPIAADYNPAQWTTLVKGDVTPPSDAAAGTPSLRTLGTGANQAAAGNDSRLSDSRTPLGRSVSTAKLADDLIPAGLSTGNAATNAIAARRIGTQAYDAAPGTLVATVDARLSAAQRTAINALDAGTATVADVVNALKA